MDSCGFLAFLRDSLPSSEYVFGFLPDSVTFWSSFEILCLPWIFSFGFRQDFVWPPADSCGLLGTPGLPSRFFAFLRIYFGFLLDSVTFWLPSRFFCLPWISIFGFLLDFLDLPRFCGLLAFLQDSLPSSEFVLASFRIL